jgi:hypothetical protein
MGCAGFVGMIVMVFVTVCGVHDCFFLDAESVPEIRGAPCRTA